MTHDSFQLSIPNPCQEDWNLMAPQENGRHCAHCSKVVIDFTKMSDKEISDFFENNHGRICGRLTKSQTKRIYSSYSEEKETNFHLPKIAASWLLVSWLSLSPAVNAQEVKPEITEQVSKNTANNQTQAPRILKGTIVDDNNENLIGANIYIKDTKTGVISDFDGNFTLEIPDTIPNQTEIIFSYLGYKTQETPVVDIDFSQPAHIQLKEEESVLMGCIIIRETRKTRRKNKLR